jgi:hypothetical protein
VCRVPEIPEIRLTVAAVEVSTLKEYTLKRNRTEGKQQTFEG